MSSALSSSKAGQGGPTQQAKLGSAVTFVTNEQGASATVASDGGGAPSIQAAGNVVVASDVVDKGIRNIASSSVNSEAEHPTPENPQATNSFSVGVVVADHVHTSTALVGGGVVIRAHGIAVDARTSVPFTAYDLEWDDAHDVVANLSSLLNTNAGVVDNVLTSYANAQSKGSELALAGAVNYMRIVNDTTAWVGHSATLVRTAPSSGGPARSAPAIAFELPTGGGQSQVSGRAFADAVTVAARTNIETINIGGNISWLLFIGNTGTTGQGNDSKAIGSAATVTEYANTTVAGIGNGVEVRSDAAISVVAKLDEKVVNIAPTSGKGAGIGGNGVVALTFLDDTTHASISDKARVEAPEVSIAATEGMDVFTPSGSAVARPAAITTTPAGTLLSNNLTLSGTSIGSPTAPLSATLTSARTLNATTTKGGIDLVLGSGAQIGSIEAGSAGLRGNVTISASGDLTRGAKAVASAPDIVGKNITLSSSNGAIGSELSPLVMQSFGTALPGGGIDGGIVDITAHGDVVLRHTGELRVSQIESLTGNFSILNVGGGIFDGLGQTSTSNISTEQLAALSQRLHLTAAEGAGVHAVAVSVTPFESLVRTSYGRYFELLGHGQVIGGLYTLNAPAIALYRPLTQAALGLSTSPTDAQVQSFVDGKFQELASTFVIAYGAAWQSRAEFQSRDPGFDFHADAVLVARLTNDAVWQQGQLVSAIDAAALRPASGVVGNTSANIVGRDITLQRDGHDLQFRSLSRRAVRGGEPDAGYDQGHAKWPGRSASVYRPCARR